MGFSTKAYAGEMDFMLNHLCDENVLAKITAVCVWIREAPEVMSIAKLARA